LKRILVTSAGGSPATNFVRSLRLADEPFHLVGTDADKYYLMRAETDSRHLVPRAADPGYVEVLNDIIEREGVEFVHAQNDAEVGFLAAHRDELHAATFLPPTRTVQICQDKFESFRLWHRAGVRVPETVVVTTEQQLESALERFGGRMWIRAKSGAGGRGALPVHDLQTARSWLDLNDGWRGDFTASELLEPDSITWMSIWHRGELVVAQGRRRLFWELARVSPSGVTGATGAGETVRDDQLDDIAVKAVLAIDPEPHGLFGVDLTFDAAGVPNPTEINVGRFFTTHHFFATLGLNMAHLFVRLGYGESVPPPARRLGPLPAGMVWIRGIDFEPVLVERAEIERHAAALRDRLQRL
jgi:3-methyl-D-ornithine--L-lysine ligase PylC-like protein